MYSLPLYKTQPNPQYYDRSSLLSNYRPSNSYNDIPMTKEHSRGDSLSSLRFNNQANSDQGSRWDNFKGRNTYIEKVSALPYRLDRPDFLSYSTDSFIENEINSTKSLPLPEPSLFTRTLWNLRNNSRKSNSNRSNELSSGSLKGSNRDSSLSRKKKSNILGLNEVAATKSEQELLNALERSRDTGSLIGQSIKRRSSNKAAPFLSTPKMPWKDSGDFDFQMSGSRTTKTTGNISSTISKTPRGGVVHQEHIVTVTENRAKEIGIATFNVVNGEIVISQVKVLYEDKK